MSKLHDLCFELEQSIMECWGIIKDLNLLLENVMEDSDMKPDDIANFVLGLSTIYNLKFDSLFRQYDSLLEEVYSRNKD